MKIVLRNGEHWLVWQTRRGWAAENETLDIRVKSETEAGLMLEIDQMCALLLVY